MTDKKCLFFILINVCVFSLFVSCKKKQMEPLVFDDTYPLALAPDVNWALVTDPYVSFKLEPDWHAKNGGHCRRGEILQVKSKTISSENLDWYEFDEGWLPVTSLTVYSNRFKAETAANQLEN